VGLFYVHSEAQECGQTRHDPCVISSRCWHPLRYGSPCPLCTPFLITGKPSHGYSFDSSCQTFQIHPVPTFLLLVSSVPAFSVQSNKLKNPLYKQSSALLMAAGFTHISLDIYG